MSVGFEEEVFLFPLLDDLDEKSRAALSKLSARQAMPDGSFEALRKSVFFLFSDDIVFNIVSFLNGRDVCDFSQTCKFMDFFVADHAKHIWGSLARAEFQKSPPAKMMSLENNSPKWKSFYQGVFRADCEKVIMSGPVVDAIQKMRGREENWDPEFLLHIFKYSPHLLTRKIIKRVPLIHHIARMCSDDELFMALKIIRRNVSPKFFENESGDKKSQSQKPLLEIATERKLTKSMAWLLRAGASPQSSIFHWSNFETPELLKLFFEHSRAVPPSELVKMKHPEEGTLLHIAAHHNLESVKFLLSHGADPHAVCVRDNITCNALTISILGSAPKMDIFEYLLNEVGVEICSAADFFKSALRAAFMTNTPMELLRQLFSYPKIQKMLSEYPPLTPDDRIFNDGSLSHSSETSEICRFLLSQGACFSDESLIYPTCWNLDLLQFCCENGMSLNSRSERGEGLMHQFANNDERSTVDCLKWILSRLPDPEIDIDQRTRTGTTCLGMLIGFYPTRTNLRKLGMLLECGADIAGCYPGGKSALTYARFQPHIDILTEYQRDPTGQTWRDMLQELLVEPVSD